MVCSFTSVYTYAIIILDHIAYIILNLSKLVGSLDHIYMMIVVSSCVHGIYLSHNIYTMNERTIAATWQFAKYS